MPPNQCASALLAPYQMPLDTPSPALEGFTMDFVTDFQESTASGCTGILVIMDRLIMLAINLMCRKDIDLPELARLFIRLLICTRGDPDNIVTDPGTQFTSRFWTQVYSHWCTDHRLSTAFQPQTARQTECPNQTMEQYLQVLSNYEQVNWVELLPLA